MWNCTNDPDGIQEDNQDWLRRKTIDMKTSGDLPFFIQDSDVMCLIIFDDNTNYELDQYVELIGNKITDKDLIEVAKEADQYMYDTVLKVYDPMDEYDQYNN